MPDVEGVDLEKLISEKMSGGASAKEMADAIGDVGDGMKEFARGATQATNSMTGVIEALHKSQRVFGDFGDSVERSSLILQSFGKVLGDVTRGLGGATSSLEGFMSTTNILATKTFPDIAKNMTAMVYGYDKQTEVLKKGKEAIDEQILVKEKEIATMTRGLDALISYGDKSDDGIKAQNDLGEKLGIAKEKAHDLKNASANMGDKIKTSSESFAKFGVVLSKALGWLTLLITAVVAVAGAYDNSIKAKREVLYMLGRLGAGYSTNRDEMDKFDKSFTSISTKWGMLRENMAKAVAPLIAVGAGVGGGGIEASIAQVRETLQEAASVTGMMMRGFGVETGLTTKALGTISTAFEVKGKALSEVFGEIAGQGQKSVLGMSRYVGELTSMYEITRRHGGGLEGTTNIMLAFDEQIKKGTMSVENLARLSTPGMMSLEQQGAIATLMKEYAPEQAKALGVEGNDVFENMYQMQKAAKNDTTAFAAGVIEMNKNLVAQSGASGEGQMVIMLGEFIKQTTGIQISSMETIAALKDPATLATLLEKPEQGATLDDMLKSSKATYDLTQTVGERTAVAVEKMRDIMIGTVQPILIGIGRVFRAKTKSTDYTEEEFKKMQGQMMAYGQQGNVTSSEMDIMKKAGRKISNREQLRGQLGADTENLLSKITRLQDEGKIGEYEARLSKATGGYIPETARYLLHAGEQVRRPGEGGGGDISVNLGGLRVSVGDRGDINAQLDEAFTRMKNDTIKEVERQWEIAQNAH